MEEIIKEWFSPAFWVNGVFVAILGGAFSILLYERCGNLLAHLSKKWQTRNEKSKAEREKRVGLFSRNPAEIQFFMSWAIHRKCSGIAAYVLCTIIMCFYIYLKEVTNDEKLSHAAFLMISALQVICNISYVISFLTGLKLLIEADRITGEIADARAKWQSQPQEK